MDQPIPPSGCVPFAELHAYCQADREFQATLDPWDPRHNGMFSVDEGNQCATVYWGQYAYDIDLDTITAPEDLVWWLYHLGRKSWRHLTAKRLALLIGGIARVKGWSEFGKALPVAARDHAHPHEAPRPRPDVAAERAKMTPTLRYTVIRRDGYRCRACGFAVQDGAALHVDHIEPVSRGGLTEIKNLQTLCTACNLGKGAS